ncbi:hypothetical protein EMIT047CA2_90169 [Pseudomonas soli]
MNQRCFPRAIQTRQNRKRFEVKCMICESLETSDNNFLDHANALKTASLVRINL